MANHLFTVPVSLVVRAHDAAEAERIAQLSVKSRQIYEINTRPAAPMTWSQVADVLQRRRQKSPK